MFKSALLLLVILLLFVEINFQVKHGQLVKRVLAAETERSTQNAKLQKQSDYWQQVVIDHPNYRDGYLQLAIIYAELGERNSAQSWLKKVYLLDPNYQLSSTLASLLSPASP